MKNIKEDIMTDECLELKEEMTCDLEIFYARKGVFTRNFWKKMPSLFAERHKERIREELILSNIPLVLKFSKSLANCGAESEDLIQCGIEALIRSVDGYNCENGTAFSTYASRSIRRAMLEEIRRSNLVYVSVNAFKECVKSVGEKELGNNCNEIEFNDLDGDNMYFAMLAFSKPVSFGDICNDDSPYVEAAYGKKDLQDEMVFRREVLKLIETSLSKMSYNHVRALQLRHGVSQKKFHNVKELFSKIYKMLDEDEWSFFCNKLKLETTCTCSEEEKGSTAKKILFKLKVNLDHQDKTLLKSIDYSQEGLSYEGVGYAMCISGERVRQLEEKAINFLREELRRYFSNQT